MKTRYVLGFLFEDNLSSVVLIQKNKPDWQVGCRNGVGGKIEMSESKLEAMVREFKEETSVETEQENWHNFCDMVGETFEVFCFCSRSSADVCHVRTVTDEKVLVTDSKHFDGAQKIPNLEWLVPMAKDYFTQPLKAIINY